jgi:hypothetical protein
MPLWVALRLRVDGAARNVPTLLDLDLLPWRVLAARTLALAEAGLTAPTAFALGGGLTLLRRWLASSWLRPGRQLGRWLKLPALGHCCERKLLCKQVGATHQLRKMCCQRTRGQAESLVSQAPVGRSHEC